MNENINSRLHHTCITNLGYKTNTDKMYLFICNLILKTALRSLVLYALSILQSQVRILIEYNTKYALFCVEKYKEFMQLVYINRLYKVVRTKLFTGHPGQNIALKCNSSYHSLTPISLRIKIRALKESKKHCSGFKIDFQDSTKRWLFCH